MVKADPVYFFFSKCNNVSFFLSSETAETAETTSGQEFVLNMVNCGHDLLLIGFQTENSQMTNGSTSEKYF